jgi:hypothetical protein
MRSFKAVQRNKDLRRGVIIHDNHVRTNEGCDELWISECVEADAAEYHPSVILIRGKENIEELHRLLGEAIENGKYAKFEGLRGMIV